MHPYCPEGEFVPVPSAEALHHGPESGSIFRAMCVKCDEYHNLHVDLGTIHGIIPREEAVLGLSEGKAKEYAVLSRVGKPVSFHVTGFPDSNTALLSRRSAQLEARGFFLNALHPGDVIPAIVQAPTAFGIFCDIGCGFPALMRIDRCCVSRIAGTASLFYPGQSIYAAVLSVDDQEGQLNLTGRELLGTWEENAQAFRQGQTVPGIVRSIMPYGVFIELTPNLSGLAEPTPGLQIGDRVSVFIRSILPRKHKIKLNVLECLPAVCHRSALQYRITGGHISNWEYFPGSNVSTYF